jgi:hypothetical protein
MNRVVLLVLAAAIALIPGKRLDFDRLVRRSGAVTLRIPIHNNRALFYFTLPTRTLGEGSA